MCYLTQKVPVFPQLDQCWSVFLFVYLVVVKPVIALTLADEDEFSENIKQLQRDMEGGGKLTLNNSNEKLL